MTARSETWPGPDPAFLSFPGLPEPSHWLPALEPRVWVWLPDWARRLIELHSVIQVVPISVMPPTLSLLSHYWGGYF